MQIKRVRIENFRCFEDIDIEFDKLTILIGENNIGKTTLLAAINKVLGFGRTTFVEEDFFKEDEEDDPRGSEPIIIEIELIPSDGEDEFSEDENAVFGYDYFARDDGSVSLIIKASHWYDNDSEEYKTNVCFIKEDEEHGYFSQKYKKTLCFYLTEAIRDIEREVLSRRGLLPRLLGAIDLSEGTTDRVGELSGEINDLISDDPAISDFREDLKDSISKIIPLVDSSESVAIQPIPVNPSDILKDSGLSLHISGQEIPHPIRNQGAGSQSVLVLSLFESYVKKLGIAAPIYGVEEPEAHLHPHAQRYVFKYLKAKGNQVILSTHSTFITDKADPQSIRLLRRHDDKIVVKTIPAKVRRRRFLSEKEREKLERTLNAEGSELFFARAVILVEGPSEKVAYPLFAKALETDFDRLGISVLMYEGDDFHIFGKILGQDALDIPYVVQPDGEDTTIKKAARRLKALGIITSRELARRGDNIGDIVNDLLIPNNIFPLWKKQKYEGYNFETYMLSRRGGTDIYLEAISEIHGDDALDSYISRRTDLGAGSLSDKEKVIEYIKSKHASKPALAHFATRKYIEDHDGSPVPSLFKRVIKKAIELSS